jgi:hypothetical protein
MPHKIEKKQEIQREASLFQAGTSEAQFQAIKSALASVFFHYHHTPEFRGFIESYLKGKGFSRSEAVISGE